MSSRSMKEQDEAAGGAAMRFMQLEDGHVVRVAVQIRVFAVTITKRYAYLQFKCEGKTVTKYLCRVEADSQVELLRQAWAVLNAIPLNEKFGWAWVTPRRRKMARR